MSFLYRHCVTGMRVTTCCGTVAPIQVSLLVVGHSVHPWQQALQPAIDSRRTGGARRRDSKIPGRTIRPAPMVWPSCSESDSDCCRARADFHHHLCSFRGFVVESTDGTALSSPGFSGAGVAIEMPRRRNVLLSFPVSYATRFIAKMMALVFSLSVLSVACSRRSK